jgi:hypothetical protein
VALLAASPNKPPGAPHRDRVRDLVGTWTCRNPAGVISTVEYREQNGGIAADQKTPGAADVHERFQRDPGGGWIVERETVNSRYSGYAPAWTAGGPWVVTDYQKHGVEIRYERVGDGTLWRTMSISGRPPLAGDVCAKGDAPPDPALCAVADIPAEVVRAAEADTPFAAQRDHVTGRVDVVVSLDAAGRVVDAAIKESASPVLNEASLAAARRSTYRAPLHDCKPVPGKYTFTVDYGGG